jgi:hypothetical protein
MATVDALYRGLSVADGMLKQWASASSVPLVHTEYVTAFEPSIQGTEWGAWFFYRTNADVAKMGASGRTSQMEAAFVKFLHAAKLPAWVPEKVVVRIDSEQNVNERFRGSYFLRTR